jgi:hypothetical protein
MIDKVEIIIGNGLEIQESIAINNITKQAYVNGKIKTIQDDFIERLIDIIKYWKNENGTKDGIDALEYTITIYDGDKKYKYHGKGVLPSNFNVFRELLGEINE